MESEVDVLIVSRRIENKRALLRTLEGLPVNTFSASTIFQALEFLATHPLAVILCEERLPDGSYRELLTSLPSSPQMNRFIVVQCTGEWEEYLEALRLGAAEVLECRCNLRTLISPFRRHAIDAEPEPLLNGTSSEHSILFRTGVQIATGASIFDRFHRLFFPCCEAHLVSTASMSEG
jgi:DNA-binding NtrC family response regulator